MLQDFLSVCNIRFFFEAKLGWGLLDFCWKGCVVELLKRLPPPPFLCVFMFLSLHLHQCVVYQYVTGIHTLVLKICCACNSIYRVSFFNVISSSSLGSSVILFFFNTSVFPPYVLPIINFEFALNPSLNNTLVYQCLQFVV